MEWWQIIIVDCMAYIDSTVAVARRILISPKLAGRQVKEWIKIQGVLFLTRSEFAR